MPFARREDLRVSRAALVPGDIVRTRRASPDGLHRAVVREVFVRDGRLWGAGPGWAFSVGELEVIRPAIKVRRG